jgi:hypothetical protein
MAGELLLRADFAACRCGCGYPPPIAKRTQTSRGIYQGERQVAIKAHGGRISGQKKHREAIQSHPVVPSRGLCQCGCGQPTAIARKTDLIHDEFAGQPQRFRKGHWAKWNAKQLAMRKPQNRQMCLTCFEPRPLLAFLDGTPVCVVCVARQRKVAEIDRRLNQDDQQRAKYRHERAIKARQAQRRQPTDEQKQRLASLFTRNRT